MKELQPIEDLLRRTALRRRLARGVRLSGKGLLFGLSLGLAASLLHKLLPVPAPTAAFLAVSAAAAWTAGFLRGFLPDAGLLPTAQWLDDAARLDERLSTALELAGLPDASPEWRERIVAEAVRVGTSVDPARVVAFRAPAAMPGSAAVLGLLVASLWIPPFRTESQVRREQEAAATRQAGTHLAQAVRQALASRTNMPSSMRQELDSLDRLATRMQSGQLQRSEAMAALAKAAEPLRQQAEALAKDPSLRRMERAARQDGSRGPVPEALRERQRQLSEALGEKAASDPQALGKLRDEARKQAEAAHAMAARAESKTGFASDNAAAARALESLAQQAQSLGHDLPQLQAAMDALAQARVDQLLKNLEQATESLEKLAAMSAEMSRLQPNSQPRGKDLAEQLEFGEGESALQSLERLMSDLGNPGSPRSSSENGEKELERSLKPAGDYGKVAEKLKQALQKSRRGDRQGARQSMADARDELNRLMQSARDSAAAREAMEALKGAQARMAAPGDGKAGNRKGGGNGGKAGSGVGTWADNTEWAFPEQIADRWDNSGVSRPDQKERGTTDRGTDVNSPLTPTKVQGQFQPGGPMPSIRLRGVGIRGQSAVGYTEAVTGAQGDARSALSEEQVPKAYRGAVKDYFDDLPKSPPTR